MKKMKLIRPTSGAFAKITTIEGKRTPSTSSAKPARPRTVGTKSQVGKSRYAS